MVAPGPTGERPMSSGPRLSVELRERAGARWRAATDHPFVAGIAAGSLEAETFAYYLAQDYVFLVGYCRVFGLAAAKAPDLATIGLFADLLAATVGTEMELHRSLSARWGVTSEQLEATVPAPACQGYVDHLLATAALGELDRIAVSLLPCQVGYAQIGRSLAEQGADRADNPYREWVRTYADPDFQQLAVDTAALVDRLGRDSPPARREALFETFLVSCRYEQAFWDMAFARQRWPGDQP